MNGWIDKLRDNQMNVYFSVLVCLWVDLRSHLLIFWTPISFFARLAVEGSQRTFSVSGVLIFPPILWTIDEFPFFRRRGSWCQLTLYNFLNKYRFLNNKNKEVLSIQKSMLYGSLCSCHSFGKWTSDFISTSIARKTWTEKWKHYTEAVNVNWKLDKRKFWFKRICIKFATSRATHHWDAFISHLRLLPDRNRKTEKEEGPTYCTEKVIVRGYLIFKQPFWKFTT